MPHSLVKILLQEDVVSIRTATIDDLDQILFLLEMMHRESSRYSRLIFSRECAEQKARFFLNGADLRCAVFVAERKGEILGFIAGLAEGYWTSNDIVAHIALFYMDPRSRVSIDVIDLICAMRAWGEIKGAKWLQADTSIGIVPRQTVKLYEELGFSQSSIEMEIAYVYRT